VYAIKAYAVEHVDKGYEHRDIYKVLDKLWWESLVITRSNPK
jgi:hypothetical protein